jgi:hypothetical protein
MLKTVSSVANALGALNYKGTWNANTNTPALASGVGTKGDYYVVSVAGATDLDGITNWGVGDWATFNGSVWQRVEGGADGNFVNLDVTGTATMGGLVVDGNTQVNSVSAAASGTRSIQFYRDSVERGAVRFDYSASTMELQADGNFFVSTGGESTRLFVSNNGNVSLYEDTGTTPKFVWDASAESLGIGTTSPTSALHVNGTGTGGTAVEIEQTATSISNNFYTMMIDSSSQISNLTNAGAFSVDVNSGRAFVINGHGNVGIGTSSPASLMHLSTSAPVLSFTDTNSFTDVNDRFIVRAANDRGAIQWYDDSLSTTSELMTFFDSAVVVNENGVDADFRVESDTNTHALFVEGSSSNVGIGCTPTTKLEIAASNQAATENTTLRFTDTDTTSQTNQLFGKIEFNSLDSDAASPNRAYILSAAENSLTPSYIAFGTAPHTSAAVERARLTSDGNFLVGTTSVQGAGGVTLSESGYVYSSRPSSTAIYADRTGSDGAIIDIRKDGTSVGSIGVVNANNLTIGGAVASHAGMEFGTNQIAPRSGGTSVDATVDLGYFSLRWKDLYLSGGVYLGGTGAANKLDDYEEGTWTPTAADATSGGNTGTTGVGSYTKIGNTIRVTAALTNVVTTGMTAGNSFYVQGFPFASGDIAGASAFFTGGVYTSSVTIASSVLYFMYDNGASALNFYDTDGAILVSDITSGLGDFYFTAIYQTA